MAGEEDQPDNPKNPPENPLKSLYDSLGGNRQESPFADTPDFRRGFEDYHLLLRYREDIGPLGGRNPKKHWPNNDLHSGEYYTKGFIVSDRPMDMKVPADTPEEYARQAGDFYLKLKEYIEEGKPVTFGHRLTSVLWRKSLTPRGPEERVLFDEKELESIRKHMIGFGKAALDEGDIEVALLSFESVGALEDSQVMKAVEEIVRDGGKDMKEDFRKTMQAIEERKAQRSQSAAKSTVTK